MIEILSPRMSASSMKWVVRMMILSSLFCLRRSQSLLLAVGSMPEVGSSRSTTLDPPSRAIPTLTFLFCPPERSLQTSFLFSTRSTFLRHSSIDCFISFFGTPLNSQNISKCSSGVKVGNNTLCCGHTPMMLLASSWSFSKSIPKASAWPPEAPNSPVSIDIVVVLPAPLWPSSAKIWPEYMVNERLSTALNPLENTLLRPLILRHSLLASSSLRSFPTSSKASDL